MKTTATALLAVLWTTFAAANSYADTTKFDAAMQGLLGPYLSIHKALAADNGKGVGKAAKQIAKLAGKLNAKSVSGKHATHYATLPKKIKETATKLVAAKDLAAQREAFKLLSRPFAMWASMSNPAGISVVFCSMAKGSWLQNEKKIANPYYGKKMLRCGEVVGGAAKGHADGHMHKGHSR